MLPLADEVWVLTRANNRAVIEADPLSRQPGLHFLYYDLPPWALKLKKQSWFRFFYFIFWQWGAYRLAARQHGKTPFDRVYHVTFAGMQAGSFMGRLGIPFVIGPIAGGERAPFRLRRSMPLRGRVSESARDLGILFQRCSPLIRPAFAAAEDIFITSAESLKLVPRKWRGKTSVHLAIASNGSALQQNERKPPAAPRFVFAGRLLHWKGAHFAIQALAEARKVITTATFTIIGSGPEEQWLREMASRYGLSEAIDFAGQFPRQKFIESLGSYTAFIYPSLHDSGGFTVLEALQEGTPVVCLDLGGPGILVSASCGFVVPTKDADEAQVVTRIAKAMISLGTMPESAWQRLSTGAKARASELSWASLTARVAHQER
jgi:glycosyltransferase involved in cell wall biosynthesis